MKQTRGMSISFLKHRLTSKIVLCSIRRRSANLGRSRKRKKRCVCVCVCVCVYVRTYVRTYMRVRARTYARLIIQNRMLCFIYGHNHMTVRIVCCVVCFVITLYHAVI
jgi:hypothetical protein